LQPFAFYGNLLQMLSNSEPLTDQTLIFISRQCIDIVEKLHSLGIYHRDIKPQNFLIDDVDGLLKVYISGFKFATKLKKSIGFSHSSYYSSLDSRLSTEVNPQQSDIFSLGLTLYTLCTGQPLFEKKDQGLKELERSPAKNWYKIEDEYKKIIDSHHSIPLPLKNIIINFLKIYPMERLSLRESLLKLN
jgi:serine/threonine protein kinase